jgi:hypothetical protein
MRFGLAAESLMRIVQHSFFVAFVAVATRAPGEGFHWGVNGHPCAQEGRSSKNKNTSPADSAARLLNVRIEKPGLLICTVEVYRAKASP